MQRNIPRRIAIIGLPGSGKSTFAMQLGSVLNIPVHHLDKHMFEGRKKRNKEEFLTIKKSLLEQEAWIIEGCSFSTLEMRFARADTVIYFDLPRSLCIWRICKRLLSSNKHLIETGCLNGINWTLIKYIWNFNQDKRQGIEELSKKYPKVNFLIFHRSQDAEDYLKNLNC